MSGVAYFDDFSRQAIAGVLKIPICISGPVQARDFASK